MKRMLALLTALLLVLGCCPAFARAGHDRTDYLGYWAMEKIILMGMEFDAGSLGYNGFMSFREDDTVVISITGDSFQASEATYADGGCTISSNNGDIPVVIDGEGKLRWESSMDGVDVSMVCVRSQAPELPAAAVPMVGLWEMTGLLLDGTAVSDVSGLGRYTVAVYGDGYGLLESPDSSVLFRLGMVDGVLQGQDDEGSSFPLTMQNGQLHVQLSNGEHEVVLITDRVGGEPAAASAAPSADNPFLGQWTCTNVKFMGMDFTLESLGLGDMSVSIGADQITIAFDGDDGSSPVRFEGNTCYVDDGSGIVCKLENGVLSMDMSVEGIALTFQLERVGEAVPAVEEPATTTTWDSNSPLASFASGGSAPVVEEPVVEEPATTTTWDSSSPLASFASGGSAPAVEEPAVEEPATTTTWDSSSPLASFASGGSAPAVEEPAVEEPVVEEPAVEEPVVEEPIVETPAIGSTWGSDSALSSFLSGGSAPAVEEPVVEGPAVEEPAVEEPTVEEPETGTPSLGFDWGSVSSMSSITSSGSSSAADTAVVSLPGATSVEGYEGTWRAVSANAVGLTFTAEELSMSGYEVRFNGAVADYVVDGEVVHTGNLVVEETGVVITDGLFRIPCHFDEEGNLVLERFESGVTLEITMTRVADAP